jgi:hypothetical protein
MRLTVQHSTMGTEIQRDLLTIYNNMTNTTNKTFEIYLLSVGHQKIGQEVAMRDQLDPSKRK